MKFPIENIELIRKTKNLSRETVAKKLKLTLSTYGKIERGETALTLERLYEIATIFKMQPEELISFNKRSKKGNITYIPVEAQAGFLSGHVEYSTEEQKNYDVPFISGKNLFMINAVGDSMFPTIANGDHIVIERIENLDSVKFGMPYVIVAKEGCVIKRIQSHQKNSKFSLVSDNSIFEPYDLDKNEILSVWIVKACLVTSLSPRIPVSFSENLSKQFRKK